MSSSTFEVLVLGAEGSGKSLLIRRLNFVPTVLLEEEDDSLTFSEATNPTTGVDIVSVHIGEDVGSVTFRELGSSMALRVSSYLPDCSCVLFVVDISDLSSLAAAHVHLLETLSYREMIANKPIAIAFTHGDLSDGDALATCEYVLQIDELSSAYPNLTILQGNNSLDDGLSSCVKIWVRDMIKQR